MLKLYFADEKAVWERDKTYSGLKEYSLCLPERGLFNSVFSVSFIVNHETELSSELQKNVSINGLIWKSVLNQ